MLFIALIFIRVAHVLCYISLLGASTNDCSNYPSSQRPYIYRNPVATYMVDFRKTSVNISDPNLAARATLQQLNCTFDRPIEWVFNLDPKTDFNVVLDFTERISRSENFTANFRLLYSHTDANNGLLLICQPVILENECERSFMQLKDGFEVVPTPDESFKEQSIQLLKHSGKGGRKYFTESECPLRLTLKIEEGNIISYKWEIHQNSTSSKLKTKVKNTNETTYFENVYRFQQSYQPDCVRMLHISEPCINCTYTAEITNYTLNGVIFYAKFGSNVFVHKGLFSVPVNKRSERLFYLDWQISDNQIDHEMIHLIVPDKVYTGIAFLAVCRVSVFFFSYGSQINVGTNLNLGPDSMDTKEYFHTDGYREVTKHVTLYHSDNLQTITCFAPLKRSKRWVERYQTRQVESASPPKINDSYENVTEFIEVQSGEKSISAICSVSGNPTPVLNWILPPSVVFDTRVNNSITGNIMKLEFASWKPAFAGTYICVAKNFLGSTTKAITFQHKEHSSTLAITLSTSMVGLAVILGCAIGFLWWKIRKQRMEFEIKTQQAIEEFKNGLKLDDANEDTVEDPNLAIHQLPYNERFEVPESKWTIENKILGSGQFGIVRLGAVMIKERNVQIAVKTMKSTAEIDEFKGFLFELKIMAFMGCHKNIVSLIAACTEGINNRDIMIGVEFCDNGSLLEYMRKHRQSFQNMVGDDGKLCPNRSNSLTEYQNATIINTHDLYRWSYHIACGMDYLRTLKVLHGDLAARNVLLTARRVAKVSDFGLSRVLKAENYAKKTQVALPWKWMAPESLSERVFSVNSDKWAYGILLYEIFTLGQSPYAGIGWSPEFINRLRNGLRLEKPIFCTSSIYKIMQATWNIEPNERPSYAKIKMKLSKALKQLSEILVENSNLPGNEETPDTAPAISVDEETVSITISSDATIDDMFPDILEAEGIYSNMPRRTMNYYKNY